MASVKKRFILSSIPKYIHTFGQLDDSVIALNPTFQIKIWSKDDVVTLINDRYTWFKWILESYDSDEKKLMSGMFLVLYTYGGFFVHPDVKCLRSFDTLVTEPMFMGCNLSNGRTKSRYVINTAVIGCVPMHSFWPHVFSMLKSTAQVKDTCSSVGCIAITRMVELFPKSVLDVCLFEPGYFYSDNTSSNLDGTTNNAYVDYQDKELLDAENIVPSSLLPTVMFTILARNKAHVLPLYLKCVECLDYPKERIHLYVHTNDNQDDTENILRSWLSKVFGKYASYNLVTNNEKLLQDDTTDAHHWIKNRKRLDVLAKIRQQSLYKAVHQGCDYYFVADCDNFLLPHTLKSLIACNKSFVAPMLHCVGNPTFSNFFLDDGYSLWEENVDYRNIVSMGNRNVHDVHIAHCTYLLKVDVIPKLTYISKHPGEWEFLTLSLSAHEQGIPQFIDNTLYYGIFLHFWSTRENEIRLFKSAQQKLIGILHEMEVQPEKPFLIFEMLDKFRIPSKEELENPNDTEKSTLDNLETMTNVL